MEFKKEIKKLNGTALIVLKSQKKLELEEIEMEILRRIRDDR